ncbi:adenosylcobinamide amidohydrolase [Halomonas sp. NCCP-2165]|nr:adenosylcobinamide amidohydrolase [Halomonas sp. NCCP-2165]GKW49945.1 hypothetical protein NCCP2165_21600 [Halomonas sp. NCCP-2165]
MNAPASVRPLDFAPGLSLAADDRCLHFASARPLRTLSSALVGGGLGWRRHFCNFHVDKAYDGRTPADDLSDWLARRDLGVDKSLAMMTAVHLEHLALVAGPGLLVAVTAGAGNAVDIAAPLAGDPRPVGTINTLVFLDAHLSDAGLVNTVLSATEAKARALQALDIRDPHAGTPASGTSTDCLAVAATQAGEPRDYAGSGTRLGRELGRAIFAATRESLIRSREARHG